MRIKLVCLAKSWKHGHYCIAGKEIKQNGSIGSWIRPVHRIFDSVPADVFPYEVGDIVSLDIDGKQNDSRQPENHLLSPTPNIQIEDHVSREDLIKYIDTPTEIWGIGEQSSQGMNDRVPEHRLCELDHTLLFISLKRAAIWKKQSSWDDSCKLRFYFKLGGVKYLFAITDPKISDEYDKCLNPNEYVILNDCYVTLSLGLPLNGFSYKLAASIFHV